MGDGSKKLFSLAITLVVGALLVFAGPVNAYSLELLGINEEPYIAGETISFQTSIDIHSDEIVDIQNLTLEINGYLVCTFDINGNELEPCESVDISLVSNTAGHGYGYGYGSFLPAWVGSNSSVEAGQWSGSVFGYGYGYTGTSSDGELIYEISIDSADPYVGTGKEDLPSSYLWYGGNNRIKISTNTLTQQIYSREHIVMVNPDMVGDGNFMMATEDKGLILTGKYDSKRKSIVGDLTAPAEEGLHYIAVGSYRPFDEDSGMISFRLYKADNMEDVGIFWYGNYSDGTWYLSPDPKMKEYLKGPMILAPQ